MKHLCYILWRITRTLLLLFLQVAWPLSYAHAEMAAGWRRGGFQLGEHAYSPAIWKESGWTVLLEKGTVWPYIYQPVPNPRPVVPNPSFTSLGECDYSHWIGSAEHQFGFGTSLMGQIYSADWQSCTGIMFPIWPISVAAALAFSWQIGHWFRHRKTALTASLCRRCSYDLRAHHPGQNCPECGTPIPAPHATIPHERSSP
jgi:hypothetical protein